jgi:putative exosortase-associated protein (TIGR04073 family)
MKSENKVLLSPLRIWLTEGRTKMKNLIVLSLILGLVGSSLGDIQDPPSNDYGPTRKFGRGLANLLYAPTEIVVNINKLNKEEGNNAAFSYGLARGIRRSAARRVAGLIELLTWPFPTWRESYYPMLPPEIPYIHAGYAEFPPEIGNESKYPYVRDYDQDPY